MTRSEYEAEFLRLYGIRKNLYDYVREVIINPRDGWTDGAHIRLMCETIQAFLEQDTVRGLIITMPPRHMKSTIISNALPAWFISNHPQADVIMASYALTLARDNARACRNLFDENDHRRQFPRQRFDIDAADQLRLEGKLSGRPNLIAAGVGGGITGKGADLFIIDDPIKDAQEQESQTYRRRVLDWYRMVVQSRLSPGGKKILVMTRWHYEDLAGAVLQEDPDGWQVLNMPAIQADGSALWPERYPADELERIRRVIGERGFNAQYQGRPTPLEGGLFKREWIGNAPPLGPEAVRCRYWDKAATHADGDYTVGCLMSWNDGRAVIEDIVRLQGSPREVQEAVRRTAERDGYEVRIRMEQEPGSSGVDIIDHYARHILTGYDFRGEKVTGSKEVRAGPMAQAFERGDLSIAPGVWNRDLIEEMTEFPLGAHDDQVDACSGAYRELSRSGEGGGIWMF